MKHLPREMEESVAKPAPIVCHWRAHGVETQKESHLGCQRLRDEPCSDTEISCLTPDKPLDHAVLVSQRVKRWKKHCLTQPWDVFIKEKKKRWKWLLHFRWRNMQQGSKWELWDRKRKRRRLRENLEVKSKGGKCSHETEEGGLGESLPESE